MQSLSASSYNDAVAGLYRLLLEPEAVIDLVSALDSLADDGAEEHTLNELRHQFTVAEGLAEHIRTAAPQRHVEYLLLRRDRRISAIEDGTGLFAAVCETVAIGQPLHFKEAAIQGEFDNALDTLAPGGQRFMLAERSDGDQPLTIAIVRAPDDGAASASYMIAAPQPLAWNDSLQRAFQSFDLTAAELRVMRAMRADQNAQDLAEKLGVSEHTVRTQIKSILSKIGMSRQGEIVRFREDAMRLSSVVQDQMRRAISDAESRDPPVFASGRPRPPRFVGHLRSGRTISYREFGDPAGKAILVLHGAHAGSMVPEGFKPAAAKLGLRIIAPERPGFGGSSPGGSDFEITDAANDTLELLAQLGVRDFQVLALASGSATGVEIASAANTGARALTLCSPHFGGATATHGPGFGFFLRQRMMRRAPWLLESGSRFMWQNMTREKLMSIVRALVQKSPADRQLVESEGLLDYFGDVVMDALQRPPNGQLWEIRALGRYQVAFSRLKIPVTLLFGNEDPVTDINGVQEAFAQAPNLTVDTLPGGQIFFYGRWPQILERFAD